jgi:hypothetical protein
MLQKKDMIFFEENHIFSITGYSNGKNSAAGFPGTGFVDHSFTAADVIAVEGFDRFAGFLIIGHFNKTETFGSAGFAVIDNSGGCNFTESRKNFAQFIRSGAVRQITDVDVHS